MPVTYVAWKVRSTDKKSHAISLYFDCSGEWVVDSADQQVTWGRYKAGELDVPRMGRKAVEIHEVTDGDGTPPDPSQVGHAE